MKHSIVSQTLVHKISKLTVPILGAVLFICANTNSCCLIHQPQVPEGLERFSKLK